MESSWESGNVTAGSGGKTSGFDAPGVAPDGLAASAIGLGLGVAAARGLEALLSALGETLPSFALVVEPRTALVAFGVGVGVTLAAEAGSYVSAGWPDVIVPLLPGKPSLLSGVP